MALFTENQTAPGAELATQWRLIIDGALDCALNMGIDETLLESVIAGASPIVRLYSWQPSALSLGVNQPLGGIDQAACARRGFGVVRRPTGGRAVLHQHEITYSVIAAANDPRVSGGVVESYRKISAALLNGLGRLGIVASLAPPNPALHQALIDGRRADSDEDLDWSDGSHGAVCFDAASDYELTAGGRKLVGSAQARRQGALLQHGSVLLDIDWDAWASVFSYRTPAGRERALLKLPTRMTSLAEQLGRQVSFDEAANALKNGFATALRIDLEPGELSTPEMENAVKLAREKYQNPAWTERK